MAGYVYNQPKFWPDIGELATPIADQNGQFSKQPVGGGRLVTGQEFLNYPNSRLLRKLAILAGCRGNQNCAVFPPVTAPITGRLGRL